MNKIEIAGRVLESWYRMELLNQKGFPEETKENKRINRFVSEGRLKKTSVHLYHPLFPETEPAGVIPEDSIRYPALPELAENITIWFGRIRRESCLAALQGPLGSRADSDAVCGDDISVLELQITARGGYIPGSLRISPLLWGSGAILAASEETGMQSLTAQAYEQECADWEKELRQQEYVTCRELARLCEQVLQKYASGAPWRESGCKMEGLLSYYRYRTPEDRIRDSGNPYGEVFGVNAAAEDINWVAGRLHGARAEAEAPMQQAVIEYAAGAFENTDDGCESRRIDLLRGFSGSPEDRSALFHRLFDIDRVSLGKWPSRRKPDLMQQLALNVWGGEAGPLCSVNGAPGTGKSELIKEIAAAAVVERAQLLAGYEDPDDAFEEKFFADGTKKSKGYSNLQPTYYVFRDETLKNHGIIAVSENGEAAGRLVRELSEERLMRRSLKPLRQDEKAVADGLSGVADLFSPDKAEGSERYKTAQGEASYPDIFFTKYANDLAFPREKEWKYWGLMAAPFYKKSDPPAFCKRVVKQYTADFGTHGEIDDRKPLFRKAAAQFCAQLEKVRELKEEIRHVSGAKERFLAQREEILKQESLLSAQIQENGQRIEEIKSQIQEMQQELESKKEEKRQERDELKAVRAACREQSDKERDAENRVLDIKKQIRRLENTKGLKDHLCELLNKSTPLLDYLADLRRQQEDKEKAAESVKQSYEALCAQVKEREARKKEIQEECSRIEQEIADRYQEAKDFEDAAETARKETELLEKEIQQAEEDYHHILEWAKVVDDAAARMTVIDDEFWRLYDSPDSLENGMAQAQNPWLHARYNREREKLFLAALQVQKEFLLASKACCRNLKNLLLLWKMDKNDDGELPSFSKRDREACYGALLNTVFLTAPVISTTYDALGGLLKDIRRPGEIGILLLDDAGCENARAAAGALYRSRRAVVLGSLGTKLPDIGEEILSRRIGKNDAVRDCTVLELADRINPFGTYIGREEKGKIWTGCPLTLHRRCISPMYDIANRIFYHGELKQMTAWPGEGKEKRFCLDRSQWIQTAGMELYPEEKDHFVREQGQKAVELVRNALKRTQAVPDLIVTALFDSVIRGFSDMIKELPEYHTDKRLGIWLQKNVGTVSEMKKAAGEVILLLGCDKNSLQAAEEAPENLVNLAVTKAKYRLYIIGDYIVWRHCPAVRRTKTVLDSCAVIALEQMDGKPETPQIQARRILSALPGMKSFLFNEKTGNVSTQGFLQGLEKAGFGEGLPEGAEEEAFGLDPDSGVNAAVMENLRYGLRLFLLFRSVNRKYRAEDMDYACCGVLLCKAMDIQLKECFADGFRNHFPAVSVQTESGMKILFQCKKEELLAGAMVSILKDSARRNKLAALQLVCGSQDCDAEWWLNLYRNLEDFTQLRRLCYSGEAFTWEKAEKLVNVLFARKTLEQIQVGKKL